MKREALLLAAILIAGMGIIVYRQSDLEDALRQTKQELRARLDATPPPAPSEPTRFTITSPESHQGEANPSADERLEKRLANLEDIVGQLVDAVNGMLDEQDQKKAAAAKAAWSPQQACGPPDTFVAADAPTAWASAQPNAGPEWLKLDYGAPYQIGGIIVRETFNPGAISKVTVVLDGGGEMPVWQGIDSRGAAPVERVFPVAGTITASSVKVYLDTTRVSGWSEIDAVGIVTPNGQRHWATDASASSSYAARMNNTVDLRMWTSGAAEPTNWFIENEGVLRTR